MAADVGSGLEGALAAARRHGTWLLVAGSFRLCGAVRGRLLRKTTSSGASGEALRLRVRRAGAGAASTL